MESVWQQSARKRWRNVEVIGDGPFCTYCACTENGMALLFNFAAEAVQAAHERCPHAFCKHEHVALKLKPVTQAAPAQFAHSVGYGRD
jgi:hypothetical protein